ncbi:hypothetical protein ACN469_30615 [Corallococcus terminator]
MPFYYYARDLLDADLHVQVEVDRVVLPSVMPGEAVVEGRVARVFRGDPAVLSSSVTFEVNCVGEGGYSGPPSGFLPTAADVLATARVMEVYLNRWKGGYGVVAYQAFVVDALTDTPRYPVTEADALDPSDAPMSWRERLSLLGMWLLMVLFFGSGLAGFGYAIKALLQ